MQYIYLASAQVFTASDFISENKFAVNMHWQYYQKAIAAYFAASNALGVDAQAQQVYNLPGDGGDSLSRNEC